MPSIRSWRYPNNTISSSPAMKGKRIVLAAMTMPSSGAEAPSQPSQFRMMGVGTPGLLGSQPLGGGQATDPPA